MIGYGTGNTLIDMKISIKRIYDSYTEGDGVRVLVDRLWPRGVRKSDAKVTLWMKEVAPSSKLRIWFGHELERWEVFRESYMRELDQSPEVVSRLYDLAKKDKVTLLYAARDRYRNHARVIVEYLVQHEQRLENESML
tara:strand:- start:1728 stop:2141 length:414 start_codon:yes stop_codon:yes gene_type:complete